MFKLKITPPKLIFIKKNKSSLLKENQNINRRTKDMKPEEPFTDTFSDNRRIPGKLP
jgi:hypothetical protein